VTDNDDVSIIAGGSFLGNACFTRATTAGNVGDTNADAATFGLGGGIALVPTCVTLAADGYTNTGTIYVGRAGAVWTVSDDESPYNAKNLYNAVKLEAMTALATDTGKYSGGSEKLINHGSVVAMGFTGEAVNKNFIYLVSANQYYLESFCVSSSLADANLAVVTIENWAAMAAGTYG